MFVNPNFVEENRREIEIEANRLHELRKILAHDYDNSYDNWISAVSNVYKRHMNYERTIT